MRNLYAKRSIYDTTQKGESLIKTKGVHLRMSETEYEILSEKAIATNMSISDFIEKETPRREICLCLLPI
ncbi:MAG: plasmid mobilization protein, partial [Blautia faecis]